MESDQNNVTEDGGNHKNIIVDRTMYDNHMLRKELHYEKANKNKEFFSCKGFKIKKLITKAIPLIGWLGHYKWKKWLVSDLIAGFTVAVMHIPQGMAYALLGNVPPITGLYMALFPVLIYIILGTSRHVSMGTFAIVCLMTGKAVTENSDPYYFDAESERNSTIPIGYSPIQVATALCFTVGVFQLLMWGLRLGVISVLLSETLISGFTTGAAIQVFASQWKDLLGIKFSRPTGYYVVVKTVRNVLARLSQVNYASIVISVICIIIVGVNNEILKPIVAKKCSFPIPIETIVVVFSTLASRFFYLQSYNITIVGEIPKGLPQPSIPHFELIPNIFLDAFSIAVVAFTVTLSMGLIFAQKKNYELDSNQELFAQGCGNIFGSFFPCIPFCASLSRSMIQASIGETQLTSLVSSIILIIILMWIGPFFEPLPKAALASIIIVSLKGMLMQVKDLSYYWKLNKMDAIVWITTFLTVVFVAIDIGLLVGVLMSLVTIFVYSFKPSTCLLGAVPNTDLFLDINRYQGTYQIPGIKIFRYSGGLNFATRTIFKSELIEKIELNPQKELTYRKKLEKLNGINGEGIENGKYTKLKKKINKELKCLILDFSSLSHIDPSGVTVLKSVIESFEKLDISVYVATRSDPVYNMIEKCGMFNKNANVKIFPRVQEAVKCAVDSLGIDLNSIQTDCQYAL